jgi:molybdopterin converting factor small subunit
MSNVTILCLDRKVKTKIHLYSGLQRYVNNQDVVEVVGTTIQECLDELVEQFPAIKRIIFDKSGNLIPNVMISINLRSPTREKLEKSLEPGDELYVIMIIAGG